MGRMNINYHPQVKNPLGQFCKAEVRKADLQTDLEKNNPWRKIVQSLVSRAGVDVM